MRALTWTFTGSLVAAVALMPACVSETGSQTSPLDSNEWPAESSECVTCSEFVYELNDVRSEEDLCAESLVLHEACTDCMCERCSEACSERCADHRVDPSRACADCMLEECKSEVQACVDDRPE